MTRWQDRTIITSPIYYCLCKTEKEFQEELKRIKVPKESWPVFGEDEAACHILETAQGEKAIIVTIRNQKGIPKVITNALLVHEAVHIWQEIVKHIQEKNPSDEFEAYSIQQISQNLMEEYEK